VLFFDSVREETTWVEHPERLEPRTRHTVSLGRFLAPPRLARAATRSAHALAARVNSVFAGCDLLLTPVTAELPPPLGAAGVLSGADSLAAQRISARSVAYTALWNLTGNPAASVPVGLDATTGLPLAVQLVGPPNGEKLLFEVAGQLERAHPWAATRPGLVAGTVTG
jgi:amidase